MLNRFGDIGPINLKNSLQMAASDERTEVAIDVKFGVGVSLIELYLWSKFGDRSSNGLQTLTVSRRRSMRTIP